MYGPAMVATHSGPYTIGDYYALPDDGQRYELLDGSLIVSPWPAVRHQVAVSQLTDQLNLACPADLAVLQVSVRIRDSVLIPDVCVVRRAALPPAGLDVEPADVELVVKIVSPTNARMDRVLKPTVYAEAGIPAFWRIELDAVGGPEIHAHEIAGAVYREVARVPSGRRFVASRPFEVAFDPAELTAPMDDPDG